MKTVPHKHYSPSGEVEVCYDRLCTRVTTSQANAAVLGGLVFLGMIWAVAQA